MKITRDQINKTQEIDLNEFVRRLKAEQALYWGRDSAESEKQFNNKEDEGTEDAYS